jgi:hypothetical protein
MLTSLIGQTVGTAFLPSVVLRERRHENDNDSTPYSKNMYFFVFFRSSLKMSRVTYHNEWHFYKPFQTNVDSNGAIRTFDHEQPAPTNKLSQTRRAVTSRRRQRTAVTSRRQGLGMRDTNRMQRVFLFNNRIQSQKPCSASKPRAQKNKLSQTLFWFFLRVLCVLRGESCFSLEANG